MMQGSEINTAAQHNLGCLWIVFQNHELGTVVQKLDKDFPHGKVSWNNFLSIGDADLVSFARGLEPRRWRSPRRICSAPPYARP